MFGLIETTRAALPALRKRPGSRIVNMSSSAGLRGLAGAGYYNACKFAVEGLSEALASELSPLDVRVIIVVPGPFSTDFLGDSIKVAKLEIIAYAETAGKHRRYRESNDGKQVGDPEKAVKVILKAVDAKNPPLHLPLGSRSIDIAKKKMNAFRLDIDQWSDEALATDFSDSEATASR